ncbi:hypothetical protein OIU85_002315 [Salix viminalis]|uniref:Glutamate receptor n=1 Tax=Salix viminalis TaxID=40686 RepID=A0A9Q0VQP5_SALVM|nr:hypothetical protein OIU85_002315 [Salix viminalis]
MSSRIGKEQRAAMEIAVEDFNGTGNQTLVLHIKDSQRDPVRAALAVMDLINNQQVQAILGPQTWEEVLSVSEISSQNQVPILSLADTTPRWASERWPYLLQASPNKQEQMKAIAAVVQSGNWHQVTVIYEDTDSSYLYNSLRDVGVGVIKGVVLSTFSSTTALSEDLGKLKREQNRVFVVHLSLPLAVRLFEKANEMKMMGKDYVWIATSPVTSLVHSNASIISSSKQGIIGVKSCFPEGGHLFRKLRQRFEGRFSIENPKDDSNEPGIYAAEAYDAVWTMAVAEKFSSSNSSTKELLQTNFISSNITEKGYKELGKLLRQRHRGHNSRGWRIATSANPLRIGVPGKSGYREFVNVTYDHLGNSVSFSGFAIEVFNETIKRLPFDLPYEFIAFNNSSYDELVKQIYLKKYDAVVGDVVLLARRYQYAEFTNPYTETGLMLIVPAVSGRREWSFITPFTKSMWVLIAVITVYNGFIIWLIERNHCPTLKGSMLHQIGIVLWLAFNTLFSLHAPKLHSNLSRMSGVVWLYVSSIIIHTYTANLTSMLTVQRLEPTVPRVEELLNSNAKVGYCTGSYMAEYLPGVLKFKAENLKKYGSAEEYFSAFKNKEISAAFLGTPYAKLFLGRYCNSFIKIGETYKIGGFGFAFPRGSPLLASVNEALLKITENGTVQALEKTWITPEKCPEIQSESSSLGPNGFLVLFYITGGTTTAAFVIYVCRTNLSRDRKIWRTISAVPKRWCSLRTPFTTRVASAEIPTHTFPEAPVPPASI